MIKEEEVNTCLSKIDIEYEDLTLLKLSLDKFKSIIVSTEINKLTNLEFLTLQYNYNERTVSSPDEIGKLIDLKYFNNHYNIHDKISTGEAIPPEIGNLTSLNYLYLSLNELTSIPPEIGKLINLENLDLTINKLISIPFEIGNLTSLKYLYIDHNQLKSLPSEIGNLSKLENLELQHNQLSSLPSEIGNLLNLKNLYLEYNQLTSLPSEIGNLLNLKKLDLEYNQLTSLPSEIVKLTNLTSLNLSFNKLRSIVLTGFENLSKLQYFYLEHNQLKCLPKSILKLEFFITLQDNLFFPEINEINYTSDLSRYFEKNKDKTWTKINHKYAVDSTKEIILTVLILSLKDKKRTRDEDNNYHKPKFPETCFYKLPREILDEILQYLYMF